MCKNGLKKIFFLLAFPLLISSLVVFTIIYQKDIWSVFASTEALRAWIASLGFIAPLAFVGLQCLQVIIFIIPGEVPQIAGGYLFGLWWGSLLSVSGIIIGSAVNFMLARLLGLPFVRLLFSPEKIEYAGRIATSPRARISMFLLFLIPGIPKDILCYGAGLTPLNLHC
nr:TVP38/TMEM64 family protein [Spirochaeta sp.]